MSCYLCKQCLWLEHGYPLPDRSEVSPTQKPACPESGICPEPLGTGCSHRALPSGAGWEVCADGGTLPPLCTSAPVSPLPLQGWAGATAWGFQGRGEPGWSPQALADTAFSVESVFFYSCWKHKPGDAPVYVEVRVRVFACHNTLHHLLR